ncbi:MAG: 5-(carboxyamino)imidazole ribonucleotide mutase [Firmicutes bacterium]|nr:5-(carboxyamino)imidazole ribonucleotide mutase [Bacillota bacterium]
MSKLVAIIMGSDSDLPVMAKTAEVLEEFAVDYSMHILSAHRTPDEALALARNAQAEGYKVLIAGAGMAAHLPGVLAAQTTLPVIGVPIASASTGGVDALWSIVQMPPGVPVATVAINGGKNAAFLALQILALTDPKIQDKLAENRLAMRDEVLAKNQRLAERGFRNYTQK